MSEVSRRIIALGGVATALTAAVAAVASTSATQRVVVRDEAGDPSDANFKRYPARRDIDLRRVIVERTGKNVRVTWETAAAARRSVHYTFNYYNRAGEYGADVEIRLGVNRSLIGWASPDPGLSPFIARLTRREIQIRGRKITVAIPARSITYMRTFRWDASAKTTGRLPGEIWDDVPGGGTTAKFP